MHQPCRFVTVWLFLDLLHYVDVPGQHYDKMKVISLNMIQTMAQQRDSVFFLFTRPILIV